MQRLIVISLLSCLAVVSCSDNVNCLKKLAEDSAVTSYALNKDSFLASTSSLNKHGYSSRQKKHDKHEKYGGEDRYESPHEGPGHAPEGPHNYGPYGSDYKAPEPKPHNYGPYGSEYEGHKTEPEKYDPYGAEPEAYSKHKDKHHGKHKNKHHGSYEHEEPYEPSYKEHDDYEDYGRGLYTKLCLQEVSRMDQGSGLFPTQGSGTTFQSIFACCDDDDDMPKTVGNCNFTATPSTSTSMPAIVGTVSGTCEFTSPGKCVPERLLREPFDITNQANATYWLVVNAALSDKSYDFGVYTATSQDTDSIKASTTAAQPEAATPAYSVDGEYMYEPSDDPMNAKRGQVYQYSAYLASAPGLLKGGTIEFTAGFVEAGTGKILCPEGVTDVMPVPDVPANGPLPTARCGEYKLKLFWAPEEAPYEGYDGTYQHPHRYYHDDGPEEYYGHEGPYHGDDGPYGYGDDEPYSKYEKHSKKHYKHAKYARKYGKHDKHGGDYEYYYGDKPQYHEPAEEYPEGPYHNETYTPPEAYEYNYTTYEPTYEP